MAGFRRRKTDGGRALLPRERRQHRQPALGDRRLFRDYLNCSVLIFDYRGYGRSEGVPERSGDSGRRPSRTPLVGRASRNCGIGNRVRRHFFGRRRRRRSGRQGRRPRPDSWEHVHFASGRCFKPSLGFTDALADDESLRLGSQNRLTTTVRSFKRTATPIASCRSNSAEDCSPPPTNPSNSSSSPAAATTILRAVRYVAGLAGVSRESLPQTCSTGDEKRP